MKVTYKLKFLIIGNADNLGAQVVSALKSQGHDVLWSYMNNHNLRADVSDGCSNAISETDDMWRFEFVRPKPREIKAPYILQTVIDRLLRSRVGPGAWCIRDNAVTASRNL